MEMTRRQAILTGANAKAYIDAFFTNVNWDEVNRRAEKVAR